MSLQIESETKLESDPCVVAWDNKLFVGTEDGSVKSFDENLTPADSWTAHSVQIFALAAGSGNVFTASNDSGVRVWSHTGEKMAELAAEGGVVVSLLAHGSEIYLGDECGNVVIYEKNEIKAIYNLLEEVKGIQLSPPYLFTVRDLDVTVTEIKPDESKERFTMCHTLQGSAPICVAGNRLLVTARGGKNLQLHDATIDTHFKKLQDVQVSDMILTSISAKDGYAWTAGWDGVVRRWKIDKEQLEKAGDINLGACVNGLAVTSANNAYAILAGGRVVRLKAT